MQEQSGSQALTRFRQYEVIEEIGSGGQGTVYKAWDTRLRRYVAIKRMHSVIAGNPALSEELQNEAIAAAQVESHQNIAFVLEFEIVDETPLFVMEYVENSLEKFLHDHTELPYQEAVQIAVQVCAGLAHIHEKMIHRDLKPGNILLTPDGDAKLTDFGFAKTFEQSSRIVQSAAAGTYPYMPHEQIYGSDIDKTADTYALGVTLYQMLTGFLPFGGRSVIEWYEQHKNAPVPKIPVSLGIPSKLEDLIVRALAKEPNDRFQSAQEMADALESALTDPDSEWSTKDQLPVRAASSLSLVNISNGRSKRLLDIGEQHVRNGEYQDAVECFSQILDSGSLLDETLPQRAFAYAQIGEHDAAIGDYNQIIESQPGEGDHYAGRGRSFAAIGDLSGAVADFTKAIESSPPSYRLFDNRGYAYHRLKEYSEAVVDFTKAIQLNGADPGILFRRASSYHSLGEYQMAANDYTRSLDLRPGYQAALLNRGNILCYALNEHELAIEDFSEVLAQDPDQRDALEGRRHSNGILGLQRAAERDSLRLQELSDKP